MVEFSNDNLRLGKRNSALQRCGGLRRVFYIISIPALPLLNAVNANSMT